MSGYCKDCNIICDNITPYQLPHRGGNVKSYCAYCLPAKYITKPIKSWICDKCNNRASKQVPQHLNTDNYSSSHERA